MINIWLLTFSFICYIVIELVRYVRYLKIYNILNRLNRYGNDSRTQSVKKSKSEKFNIDDKTDNYRKFLDDLENYPELMEDNIKDLYCSQIELECINYDDVCESFFDIVERDSSYINKIKKLVKKYKLYVKQHFKRNILPTDKTTKSKKIKLRRSDINSWFQLLPMYSFIKTYDFLINIYMRIIGYSMVSYNGLNIWHNGYDPKRGKPIVFFHASVGGVTLQISTLHKYSKKYNLIMPDIPGMNFTDSGNIPLTMKKVCDTVIDFMKKQYTDKDDCFENKINLMGHSLGNNFCCYLINRYPILIDNFFCIEGQIFFHRSLKIYKEFERNIFDIPITDILSVPLLYRDMYVQYFIQRLLKADESFIYDLSNTNSSHINIHMFHSKTDKKFLIDAQLQYADIKDIPLICHIFTGGQKHGAFILDSEFREYIFKQIELRLEN
jgi:pimeloyl-ACP methyl ester carboxylesterase